MDARAVRYPAATLLRIPAEARMSIQPPVFQMRGMSPLAIPLSTMSDMRVGRARSASDCTRMRKRIAAIEGA